MDYPDLGNESQVTSGKGIRAVGWLGYSYKKGRLGKKYVALLKGQVADAYQPFLYRGVHYCGHCNPESPARGSLNLLIPHKRWLYVAPEMIVHYVEAHGYLPPREFLDALVACPPQRSDGYFKLIDRFAKAAVLSESIWPPSNILETAALTYYNQRAKPH